MDLLLIILGMSGAFGAAYYFYTSYQRMRTQVRIQKRRQELKIVVNKHAELKKALAKDKEQVDEMYRKYRAKYGLDNSDGPRTD